MFRLVLLQDVVALTMLEGVEPSSLPILKHHPFSSPAFKQFVIDGQIALTTAETEAREHLHNLPEKIAAAFRGSVESLFIRQQEHIQKLEQSNSLLREGLITLTQANQSSLQVLSLGPGMSKKRKAALESAALLLEEGKSYFSAW